MRLIRLLLIIACCTALGALLFFSYRKDLAGSKSPYDLTLIGFLMSYDGLGRQPIWLIDCLKDDLRINWIAPDETTIRSSFFDVPEAVAKVALNQDIRPGTVSFFTDILVNPRRNVHKKVPSSSLIKIASSMMESPVVPDRLPAILNKYFDAVVVPDIWMLEPYKAAGVTIPIFVIPLGLYLENFLNREPRAEPHYPFVFGNTCAIDVRKNHIKLIEAFYHAFGNSPDVKLRINARFSDKRVAQAILDTIQKLNATNIQITFNILSSADYYTLMDSIDCYVTLSQGEGFSIPPREALAAGIPVILSDNTAHKTICQTDFTRPVSSPFIVNLPYDIFGNKRGHGFDCSVEEASKALRDVYDNYDVYLKKAQQARTWANAYTKDHLRKKYFNLIKPRHVLLGNENVVTDDYLMITSKSLFNKYRTITGRIE